MAFNSQIKGYMTFGKSFSRGGAFPLEAYEIWTDYDALVAYAANTDPAKDPSYIGQKVAYVDIAHNKVTHYGIEIDGTLKEIGAATNGDGFTIDLENGVLSLHGINDDATVAGMLPRVEVTDGKKGIKWVPISEVVQGDGNKVTTLTSLDGSVIIEATTDTDSSLVYDLKVTHPAIPVYAITSERNTDDNATIYHLTKDGDNVEKEIIVPDAYNDTALAGRVKTLEDAGYQTADDVNTAITSGIANKADKADTLAGYGITDAYTKGEVDTELAKKAAQTDLEALEGRVDAFLTGTGATDALDSLQELIEYINTHDDEDISGILASIQALEVKVDTGDQKVSEYVTAAIDALKIGDYAKAADLTALAGKVEVLEAKPFDTYATKGEVNAKVSTEDYNADKATFAIAETVNADLAKKVDTETYNTDKATFAVASEVANTYATKQLIGEIPSDADATTIIGYINEKAQEVLDSATGGSSESAASVKQQLDSYKAANDPKVNALLAEVYGALAEGATEYNYAADSRIDALEEAGAAQDALIASNTKLAQKGVDDAKTANDSILELTKAGGRIASIEANVTNLQTISEGHGTSIADHETRVVAIETSIADGGALDLRIDALEGFKASQTEVNATLNTAVNTTLPEAIAKKLDASEISKYSTTEAMNTAIENATKDKLVASDLADYAKGADVANTYATIAALEGIYKAGAEGENATGLLAEEIERAKAAEKANADAIALLTENPTEAIDSVKELVDYVNEHGATVEGINDRLDGHDALLAGIGGTDQPATVVAAIEAAVDSLEPLAIATATKLGGIYSAADVASGDSILAAINKIYVATDGVAEVKAISTDILQNGVEELVLFGGDAGVAAAK